MGRRIADVVDLDARRVELRGGLGEHRGATGDRDASRPPGVLVDGRRADRTAVPAASRASASRSASATRDLEPLATDLRLELVGRALGDDLAVVDHHDLVGEPVGLLEVLGGQQQRRAAATRSSMTSHISVRPRGSRPVVGSSRKSTGGLATRAPARSSRRRMPPEYVLTGRSAGVGEVELLEQLARPLAGPLRAQVVEPADHVEVLEAGEVLVDRRVLAGQADLPAHAAWRRDSTSMPGDLARPASGCSSV